MKKTPPQSSSTPTDATDTLAAIGPVARSSVVDAVSDRLRNEILAGRIAAGSRLPSERERQLSFGREPRSRGDAAREDLVPETIGHRIDDARAGHGTDGSERIGGIRGRGRRLRRCFLHRVIRWLNQLASPGEVRNTLRTVSLGEPL